MEAVGSIVERKVTNSLYKAIKHTRECKYRLANGGYYQCYQEDSRANIKFSKERICRPPPAPCGLRDDNGNPCRLVGFHIHHTIN